ncbi:MAG TPA: TetR/AcrR family transcriptional regulator [Clostridia bacterium]|nr:TetR/AcrR family transcriptional regulator [Clostridia bacterium]
MPESKKEQIRQAAITVIAREGFHAATTDKIASEAGVAVGTIYNYFSNKEDILQYIFQVEYEKRAAFLAELSQKELGTIAKIRAMLEMHFTKVQENPNLVKVILAENRFGRRQKENGLLGLLEQIIRTGIARKDIRPCHASIIATILFGAIEAIMARYLAAGETKSDATALSAAVEEIIGLISRGLATG